MLKIYNSLTRKIQTFKPLIDNKVKLYVCGNTVYDYCHLGHARSMILFDVIVRYLRSQGYEVIHVRNITDIDDKIINRALENNEPIEQLTERFIHAQREDEAALKLLPPTHEPRATEYVAQMLALIEKLIAADFAYQADNGDICFRVRKFTEYGKLSGNTIDQLHGPDIDFVLWKSAKPNEPYWPSPWGNGRPGWHIECSAMSSSLLGQPFDIHGGGMDLKFPHHENEIAQSEAADQEEFAKLWMHVGLLKVNGEKMSKSLGNFVTIRDALTDYHPEELRFFMLNSHYNQPADYTKNSMHEAKFRLESLYRTLLDLPEPLAGFEDTSDFKARFQQAMDDNFNTSVALAVLADLGANINRMRGEDPNQAAILGRTLKQLGNILGILQYSPAEYFIGYRKTDEVELINSLIQARELARTQKNWQEADRIRQQLSAMNIILEDKVENGVPKTFWRRA